MLRNLYHHYCLWCLQYNILSANRYFFITSSVAWDASQFGEHFFEISFVCYLLDAEIRLPSSASLSFGCSLVEKGKLSVHRQL